MLDALDRADADDDVRAIIVTGSGRAFCAARISRVARERSTRALGPRASASSSGATAAGDSLLRIYDCKKPIIAAINGPAVGVGVTMTLR